MKVVNLFAGPGAGKSTTAAGLFSLMKNFGIKAELVTEFAKDLTYEGRDVALSHQLYVLGEQFHRLARLRSKVDYVITDAPLLHSVIYAELVVQGDRLRNAVQEAAWAAFHDFDNANFFLIRTKPYAAYGRVQTEHQARLIDADLKHFLTKHDVDHATLPGDREAPARIYRQLGLPVPIEGS